MQNVVQVLEKQYLEEKRTALEEQRAMYERELESLRQQLSPEKTPPPLLPPHPHHNSGERLALSAAHAAHSKLRLWTEERWVQLFPLLNHGSVRRQRCDARQPQLSSDFSGLLSAGALTHSDSHGRFCSRCRRSRRDRI